MRYAVNVPNFGALADPCLQADLAKRAEVAGWDGYFVWDHLLVDVNDAPPVGDVWVLLAAVAAATTRVRIGPMVAALPRRRPWDVARAVSSLDQLSGGRMILGAGAGTPVEADFAPFGDETDLPRRAAMLDEALAIITGLWSGETFGFTGRHYRLADVQFRPTPVQRPRVPIWVGAMRPGPLAPLRRAARWDGLFPVGPMGGIEPCETAGLAASVHAFRQAAGVSGPFDIVASGSTPAGDRPAAAAQAAAQEAAGATWWHEFVSEWLGGIDEMRSRIEAGPPRG